MAAQLPAQTNLKPGCLNFSELLAQAVALISPTMTAALIIPVMYSNTGDWSWLSYLLGGIMLLFVAFNLNVFARRSTGSGSMYAYISRGLGVTSGGIGGWSLIWAYLGISLAGATGFSIFAGKLLAMMGLSLPFPALIAICLLTAWFCAWKNVQLSALIMLVLEGASVALITVLCVITLAQHGFAIDHAQFNTTKLPYSSMGLGVVVAIFSLVGFECATAFGDEAKNPLKTIPRAVIVSLLISAAFFVFVTYVMVFATRGYSTTLDQIDAPLNVMAQLAHMPYLQPFLSLGAMLSFFALALSCINAGGRVVYAMGRHGLFHTSTATAHATNETPHIAVTVSSVLAFVVAMCFYARGVAPLDMFNDFGTLAAFGFLVPYILITIAAPIYLKRLSQLTAKDIAICAASLALLVIPTVGSVYPIPPAPVRYFPYAFVLYLVIGAAWVIATYKRSPQTVNDILQDLDITHARHQPSEGRRSGALPPNPHWGQGTPNPVTKTSVFVTGSGVP